MLIDKNRIESARGHLPPTLDELAGLPEELLDQLSHRKRRVPHGNQNTNKEFCPKGHPLSGANLIVEEYAPGLRRRRCKKCFRAKANGMKVARRQRQMAERYIAAWLSQ